MVVKRWDLANRAHVMGGGPHHVYGIHPVSEWLRSRPTHLMTLYYDARAAHRLDAILQAASAAGVALQASTEPALTRLAGTSRHQGLVAAARPFPYADLNQVLARAPRLLVVADQIQDPQNLGALLRTAEAVGAGAVIIPKDGAVAMTASVEAAAAGAAALIPVCRVTNTARTLATLKQGGYWSVGLQPSGGTDLYKLDLPQPLVVVVGGEAGMRPLVAKQCDFAASIPMFGRIESLNASVAAGVALYEVARRWRS